MRSAIIYDIVQLKYFSNLRFTPHQFYAEEDMDAAAAGPIPKITLTLTDKIYPCSMGGPKVQEKDKSLFYFRYYFFNENES